MKKKDIIFLVVVFIGLAGIAAGFYLTHQDTGASAVSYTHLTLPTIA